MIAGWIRPFRWLIPLVAVAGTVLYPSSAFAHAGQTDPVASSYRATITSVPAGLAVKVVDGDQRLWMSANPRLTVIVVGRFGEPYLRFSATGVDENLRSPTAYLNLAIPVTAPPGTNPKLPPSWKHLTGSHTYMWHEDRLHALALVAGSSASGQIGPWNVPLAINGHKEVISGQLFRAADPSLLWFWPILVILACVAALLRIGDQRITRLLGRLLALATIPAVVVVRMGRELYGHPGVSTWQHIDLVLTCLVAVAAALALLRSHEHRFLWFIVGAAGVYQGAVLLPAFTHGYVLTGAPAAIERAVAAASIACGLGAGLCFVFTDDTVPKVATPPCRLAVEGSAPP